MARAGDDALTRARAREPHELLIFPDERRTPRQLAVRV